MDKERQHILISRYLAKETSQEEAKELFQWIESSSVHKKHFEEMQSLWDGTVINDTINNQNKVRDRLLMEINRTNHYERYTPYGERNSKWFYRAMVAASLAVVLVMGYFLIPKPHQVIEAPVVAVQEIIKSNPIGQKSRIFLPDGSNVWLNAESTVRYDQNFGESSRDIHLEGEAYFEVVKNQIPFVVHNNDLTVTALGTSFNVCAYPKEEKITVALVEGKVAVQRGDMEEVLNPDELLIIGNFDNKGLKYTANAFEISSWKDGILIFQADPLEEIISKVERWYGVEVVVEGLPDAALRFTGRFQNEYLKNILESMSYGQNMEYQIRNKKVKLIFN